MDEQLHIDSDELFLEIARYLAAVDVYRGENCEPTWLAESAPSPVSVEPLQVRAEHASSAH
jgi:hypothetical protein